MSVFKFVPVTYSKLVIILITVTTKNKEVNSRDIH
jgi:hypothetical protein